LYADAMLVTHFRPQTVVLEQVQVMVLDNSSPTSLWFDGGTFLDSIYARYVV